MCLVQAAQQHAQLTIPTDQGSAHPGLLRQPAAEWRTCNWQIIDRYSKRYAKSSHAAFKALSRLAGDSRRGKSGGRCCCLLQPVQTMSKDDNVHAAIAAVRLGTCSRHSRSVCDAVR
jgi:hypothetical protein